MKRYDCDGGTIMIGTRESRVCLPNGYGDGCFTVDIIKTKEQRDKFNEQYNKWNWLGAVTGDEYYVWSYDCLHDDELNESNILYTLSGRYGVYYNNGNIMLVKS